MAVASVILTVDSVAIEQNKVLLIQRRKWPFEGMWALPGGKVEETDPTLEDAAKRELHEEAGISVSDGRQIATFGNVGRDPRPGRWVSTAFLARITGKAKRLSAGSDASDAQWFPLDALPTLAFDHANILAAVRFHLQATQHDAPTSFQEMMNERQETDAPAYYCGPCGKHQPMSHFPHEHKHTKGSNRR